MSTQHPSIAIIGLGPRGVCLVERLAQWSRTPAARNIDRSVHLHLIDDAPAGAGRIWDPEQTPTLCMNTLAGAVTLFTEPDSGIEGPILEGPTLYEWICLLRDPAAATSLPGPKVDTFALVPVDPAVRERFDEELARTRPESHPSRALYGAYIRWCLDVALSLLDDSITVHHHRTRARTVRALSTGATGRDIISLADGSTIIADSTIIAPGWLRPAPTPEEEQLADAVATHPQLTWVRPDNPVEQPVEDVPESGSVLVRGLGMGFFDVMALLTIDRGGRFVEDPSTRSGLRYEPSGREPHLMVTSHRGYPYLPKSEYHSLPPEAEIPRLKEVKRRLRPDYPGTAAPAASSIDFRTEVWPAILRDAAEAYYRTLARTQPEAFATPSSSPADASASASSTLDSLIARLDAAPDEGLLDALPNLAAAHVPAPADRLDLRQLLIPLRGSFSSAAELGEHIGDRMARDISEAVDARDSALKSALWSVSASRKPASIIGAEGAYTWDSRPTLSAFMSLGQMVGSGPPLFRTRQLLALFDAGLVTFLGADPQLTLNEDGLWEVHTASLPDHAFSSPVLVDAWMHRPTIGRCDPEDPLLSSLAEASRLRPFSLRTPEGTTLETGSPEVERRTRVLVHPDGSPDPRVHLVGIPTYAQMPDTTISPIPGTQSLMLQETSAAAKSAWEVAVGITPEAPSEPVAENSPEAAPAR